MFRVAAAFLLILPIAAAASPGAFASIEEFARAIARKQGGWQTKMKVTAADVRLSPGADPADFATTRARIQSQVGIVTERNECVGPGSDGDRLPGILIDPTCSFSRLEAGDGRWALDSRCPGSGGVEMDSLKSTGTYSPDSVTGRHEGIISQKGIIVHLKAETESRYIGECRPTPPMRLVPAPEKD